MNDASDPLHGSSTSSVGSSSPRWRSGAWPLWVAIAGLTIGFASLRKLAIQRVGDGSEYYAMFIAWRDTMRPFMSEASWAAYGRFVDLHLIRDLAPADALRATFPTLVSGATADLNHFWFYSALAALVSALAGLGGVHIAPHDAFMALHWLLGVGVLAIAWATFRTRGVAGVALALATSPVLWSVNKVHTEWFTVCLTVIAVLFVLRDALLPAALALAVASTQNVSFAGVAGVLVVAEALRRGASGRYVLADVAMLCASFLLVLLHPLYYFSRLGVLDPQLLAGGAAVGAHLTTMPLWLLDPDEGLLPNWPLAIAALLVSTWVARVPRTGASRVVASRPLWLLFVGAYLSINLFAQSSTVTLNSGGSPGPARYGFWYIALFVPALMCLIDWVRLIAAAGVGLAIRARAVVAALLIVGGIGYGAVLFDPAVSERNAFVASWSSDALQRWLPGLYDPPVPIFLDRFAGVGWDPILREARVVVGPDCAKLVSVASGRYVFGGRGCGFSPSRLLAAIEARPDAKLAGAHYVRLTPAEQAASRLDVEVGKWYPVGRGRDGDAILGAGWGQSEPDGVWSAGSKVQLDLRCPLDKSVPARELKLSVAAFVTPVHDVSMDFAVETATPVHVFFAKGTWSPKTITLAVPPDACSDDRLRTLVHIDAPVSPAALGLSGDSRELGLWLTGFGLQ